MDSPPGDALPKVKEEQQDSHHEDSFPKVSEEEEEHPEDSFAKVFEEEKAHPGDAFAKVVDEDEAHPGDSSFQVKKEDGFTQSGSASPLGNVLHEPQNYLQTEEKEDDDVQIMEDEDDQSYEYVSNQLVVYDPGMNSSGQIEPVSEPTEYQPPPFYSYRPNPPSRVLPAVRAYTVQCANCFKWRLIPTKEKYEEIRESILQQPFVCGSAREWRPDITCEDPADINQDNSRLWAIDKPNIAQLPPGWERLLTIRSEGSTKFADVYYAAPTGKKLRSTVEVQKYLLEHPEYMHAGVHPAQFSFQIPKPLQENYVRKRPRIPSSMSRPLEPTEDLKACNKVSGVDHPSQQKIATILALSEVERDWRVVLSPGRLVRTCLWDSDPSVIREEMTKESAFKIPTAQDVAKRKKKRKVVVSPSAVPPPPVATGPSVSRGSAQPLERIQVPRATVNKDDETLTLVLPTSASAYSDPSFLDIVGNSMLFPEDERRLDELGVAQSLDWSVAPSYQAFVGALYARKILTAGERRNTDLANTNSQLRNQVLEAQTQGDESRSRNRSLKHELSVLKITLNESQALNQSRLERLQTVADDTLMAARAELMREYKEGRHTSWDVDGEIETWCEREAELKAEEEADGCTTHLVIPTGGEDDVTVGKLLERADRAAQ